MNPIVFIISFISYTLITITSIYGSLWSNCIDYCIYLVQLLYHVIRLSVQTGKVFLTDKDINFEYKINTALIEVIFNVIHLTLILFFIIKIFKYLDKKKEE